MAGAAAILKNQQSSAMMLQLQFSAKKQMFANVYSI
jgi:hypothetical protein